MNYKRFTVNTDAGVTLVRFSTSKLERAVVADLNDELLAFVRAERPDRVLVDFTDVVFISSEAINLFFVASRQIQARGGGLKFCLMEESVRRVFHLLKLDESIFEIYESTDDAIAAFEAQADGSDH